MKKIFKYTFLVILILMNFACQKNEINSNKQQYFSEDNTYYQILKFIEKTKTKSSESLSLDSALWYLEAALNLNYTIVSDTGLRYTETYSNSLEFSIEEKNSLPFSKISEIFDNLNNSIEKSLKSINFKNKQVLVVDGDIKDNKLIFTYLIAYNRDNKPTTPPTHIYGDWHFGGKWIEATNTWVEYGMCDWTYYPDRSGATEIARVIRYNDTVLANVFFTNVIRKDITYNDPDYQEQLYRPDNPYHIWEPTINPNTAYNRTALWYGFGPKELYPCINEEELNWYKDAAALLLYILKHYVIPPGYAYKTFEIHGKEAKSGENRSVYHHTITIWRGIPHKVIPAI